MALQKNKGVLAGISCIASVTLLSYVGSAFAWSEGDGNDGGHASSIAISSGPWSATTNSDEAIALGSGTIIGNNSDFSTAIGMNSNVKDNSDTSNAWGYWAHVGSNSAASNAIGRQSVVGDNSVGSNAIGFWAQTLSSHANAIGQQSIVGENAAAGQAIGFYAQSYAERANAIGMLTKIEEGAVDSTAIGTYAYIGEGSIGAGALGAYASVGANAVGATAIGYWASVGDGATNAQAFGTNARASGIGSVALGSGSVASEDNIISVGDVGAERRITNIEAGIALTDAVNVGQLKAVDDFAVKYDKDLNGNPDYTSITLGSSVADAPPVVIKNVRAGTVSASSNEAVNGAQLYELATSSSNAFGGGSTVLSNGSITNPVYSVAGGSYNNVGSALSALDNRIDGLEANLKSRITKESSRAAAVGLAAASLRYDDRAGKLSVAMGGGYWRNEGALAFGAGYTSQSQTIRANVSAATSGSQWGVGAGLSFTLN